MICDGGSTNPIDIELQKYKPVELESENIEPEFKLKAPELSNEEWKVDQVRVNHWMLFGYTITISMLSSIQSGFVMGETGQLGFVIAR